MRITGALVLIVLIAGCAAPAYQPGLRETNQKPPSGVTHVESRFAGDGGVSLLEQGWNAQSSKSPRAVIAIVHGLKDHSGRYATFAQTMVQKGYVIRAFDLRGHGDSQGDRVWISSFDEYLADLGLFLGLVKAEFPHAPIYLMGHSMGGTIATLYSLKNQAGLAGLILSAPAIKRGENVSGILAFSAKILGSITPTLAVLDLKDEDFSRDAGVVGEMRADPLIYDKNGPARTGKELLRAIAEVQDHMKELSIPVLALHGTEDKITNPDGSRELAASAASKDKTLKLFTGYYHDLLHEPGHEQVSQEIITWLDQRTKP